LDLQNSFVVPADIDQAWATLMDVERLAPCLPGATLESYEGDDATGKVKVKVGPVQMTYTGKVHFVERDEATHRMVMDASGREARGSGTAAATATATLHDEGGDRTRVDVVTDLTITGKAAQFGRGVLQDVAAKIVGQFADNLAALMAADAETDRQPAAEAVPATESATPAASPDGEATVSAPQPAPAPRPTPVLPHNDEAIDLLDTAGAPVLKRVAPILAAITVVGLIWWLLSRRGRRG
jgi:carbon monoxide dehydrogenase subunit G